jgi:hypothetical protein
MTVSPIDSSALSLKRRPHEGQKQIPAGSKRSARSINSFNVDGLSRSRSVGHARIRGRRSMWSGTSASRLLEPHLTNTNWSMFHREFLSIPDAPVTSPRLGAIAESAPIHDFAVAKSTEIVRPPRRRELTEHFLQFGEQTLRVQVRRASATPLPPA